MSDGSLHHVDVGCVSLRYVIGMGAGVSDSQLQPCFSVVAQTFLKWMGLVCGDWLEGVFETLPALLRRLDAILY